MRLLCWILVIFCISFVEAKTWSFSNWNSFKKASVGSGSSWDKKWGIPTHSGWSWIWDGAEDISNVLVKDPSGKSKDLTLGVVYPKNSRNPEANPVGGIGFRAQPIKIPNNVTKIDFQYSIYFPRDFDFVKGGKLPGLFGGHGECTGGDESNLCFTSRIMWRKHGKGEIYAYLPQSKQRSSLCEEEGNICNSDYGFSLGRGKFSFKKGAWVTVRQVLTMNQVGKQDGRIVLYTNGKKSVDIKGLVWRVSSEDHVVGILFHTFFGGSDNSWETHASQRSYFKGFKLKTI